MKLVELIENGEIHSRETDHLAPMLQPMIAQNIDAGIGLYHYPILFQIKTILGNDIKIIDSGEAVARQTKKILMRNNQLNSNKIPKSLIDFIPIKNPML